jgi:hypothetical protein
MHSLTAAQLLKLWEVGQTQTPLQRGLSMLVAAFPEIPVDTLAGLSIGQRDRVLLRLREVVFGTQLSSVASCPSCQAQLELSLNTVELLAGSAEDAGVEVQPHTENRLEVDGWMLVFRLPNSQDLMAVAQGTDLAESRLDLLQRCLLSVKKSGKTRRVHTLPLEIQETVIARMAELDPFGDVQLALSCPACAHKWRAPLDILAYFWAEIQTWAIRILHEVHLLAAAYGWSEADILQLSAWRRQAYLRLVLG